MKITTFSRSFGRSCWLLLSLGCAPEHQLPPQNAGQVAAPATPAVMASAPAPVAAPFRYRTEAFADIQVLRYRVPGFEQLDLNKKRLAYFLYEAGLAGHDITYDQKYKHNLAVRRTLEAIWRGYAGDRSSKDFKEFELYTKRFWAARGIHHDYSAKKLKPGFSPEFFTQAVRSLEPARLPLSPHENVEGLLAKLTPILFDPSKDAKRVNLDQGADLIATSANNFYEGLTQREVEAYYRRVDKKHDPRPISQGLNSKLLKENGKIVERVWKVGGMYSPAIEKIVFWLEKASAVAEDDKQRAALDKLIEYYRTGELRLWDEHCIAWLSSTAATLDIANGFIETYGDAMSYRADYESVLSMQDVEASRRIASIGGSAQWFEDHSPILPEHKKQSVQGISARVISVIAVNGDAAAGTPIGINLPNAEWIRQEHGSKSVSLGNIVDALYQANKESGLLEEFAGSPAEAALERKFEGLHAKLHTDMHEVIGHASGQLNPGVKSLRETFKNYSSTLEEARADLVALYYIADPKLQELGLVPTLDVGKVAYNAYLRNGLLVQLSKLELGANVEEAHMRDRQLVSRWVLEKGAPDKVVELVKEQGKTYVRINDYQKLRALFGELLREVQRIKSSGDFAKGQALIETYGVKVDQQLHQEVLARYAKLGISPYSVFIQPKLTPIQEDGQVVDVTLSYPEDFAQQMLEYDERYSFLPTYN